MRVGIQIPLGSWSGGGSSHVLETFRSDMAEDGKLGRWLKMHDLLGDAQIMDYAGSVIIDCTDDQYVELLMGFKGVYSVEIISK